MDQKKRRPFDRDEYIEHLLLLRMRDPVQYEAFPDAVKKVIEEYEREKEAVTKDSPPLDPSSMAAENRFSSRS